MNSNFRIVKGVGVEVNGRVYPTNDADLCELCFTAGQVEAMRREKNRYTEREKLDAIAPMVAFDVGSVL